MRAPRVLIVTRHTPLPWEDGAGAYLHDMARHLSATGFVVSILWLAPHEHLRWKKLWRLPAQFSPSVRLHLPGAISLGRRRFFFPAVIWQPFRARVLGLIRRALKLVALDPPRRRSHLPDGPPPGPRPWASPPTAVESSFVECFAAAQRPDVVIANYAWMCPLLDLPALRAARHVCIAHDVGWKRAELSASTTPPAITRDEEAAWLSGTDLVVAISQADAAELRTLAPRAQVVVAPKAIGLSPPFPTTASEPNRLLFVGSDNPFNAEGLEWFLREIWPGVLRAFPGASLHVCGSIDRIVVERPDSVAFHGVVPVLDEHYASAALVIVPLLRATGMNIKLVDAAAVGRAIVTTSATLVGAPFLRGAVAVADSAGEFSAEVCRLLGESRLRNSLAARALAAVREHLAPAACYDPLANALRTRP